MATAIQDDGFHEIQLNGKQLVFLFMAATVVLVVSFLLGVQVGRNVQTERGPLEVSATSPEASPTPIDTAPSPTSTRAANGAALPASTTEVLSYSDRLQDAKPPNDRLDTTEKPPAVAEDAPTPSAAPPTPEAKTPVEPVEKTLAGKTPVEKAAAPKTAAPLAAAAGAEPAGNGFAIQVAGLSEQGEAEAYARRLSSKGFSAYVVAPVKGARKPLYRVRVGKFTQRREADRVAARLAKEEKIKPWVLP